MKSSKTTFPFRVRPFGAGWNIIRLDDAWYDGEIFSDRADATIAVRKMRADWRVDQSGDQIKRFLHYCCEHAPGSRVTLKEFFAEFQAWLPEDERLAWGKHSIRRNLPAKYPCARGPRNQMYIGNLVFMCDDPQCSKPGVYYYREGERLKKRKPGKRQVMT